MGLDHFKFDTYLLQNVLYDDIYFIDQTTWHAYLIFKYKMFFFTEDRHNYKKKLKHDGGRRAIKV